MNIALIGVGRWGKNLLRVFNDLATVKYCITRNKNVWISEQYPRVVHSTNYRDALNDSAIDAVVIATPISELYTLAREALLAKKHVFLEKPMAQNTKQVKDLADLARKNNLIFFGGYIFLHHETYRVLKDILMHDPAQWIETTWNKFGSFEGDILLNLASHEIAIILSLMGRDAARIELIQKKEVLSSGDIMNLSFNFGGRVSAFSTINRVSPHPSKEVLLKTNSGRILYWRDQSLFEFDRENNIFDRIFEAAREALVVECSEFLNCVRDKKTPVTDGVFGVRVLSAIEHIR